MPYQPNLMGDRLFQPQLNSYWSGQIGAGQAPQTGYQAPTLDQLFNMPGANPQQAAAGQPGAASPDLRFQFGANPTLADVLASQGQMWIKRGGPGK